MESNIHVFHETERRTMAFRGPIKQERWSRVLNPVDKMTRVAVSRAIGEGAFDYNYTWRTNSSIIGAFIGCLTKAGLDKWDMSRLCTNLFNATWTHGMEEAIGGMDERGMIPSPEVYMCHLPGSQAMTLAPRRHALDIRNSPEFNGAWPNMKASIDFLLRWRGIKEELGNEWLLNFLNSANAYIMPGTDFTNRNNLDFSLPNFDRSSKEKSTLIFPPGFVSDDPSVIAEVMIVFNPGTSMDFSHH